MYIWKTKMLAEDLKSESLKQSDYKKYYVATSVITLIGLYLSMLEPPEVLDAMIFEAITSILITVIGLNFIFKTNGGDNGVNYLNRLVSLSFPLLIKIIAISFVLTIALETMREFGATTVIICWAYSISIAFIQVVFFWRINSHVKYINT